MAYEEKIKTVKKPHHIMLEDRKHLTVSGVEDVVSFDENEITLETSLGSLVIRGADLKLGKVSTETGDAAVEGSIRELGYQETAQSGSLWARLFK